MMRSFLIWARPDSCPAFVRAHLRTRGALPKQMSFYVGRDTCDVCEKILGRVIQAVSARDETLRNARIVHERWLVDPAVHLPTGLK